MTQSIEYRGKDYPVPESARWMYLHLICEGLPAEIAAMTVLGFGPDKEEAA